MMWQYDWVQHGDGEALQQLIDLLGEPDFRKHDRGGLAAFLQQQRQSKS